MDTAHDSGYGEAVSWSPQSPRFRPLNLVLHWLVSAVAVFLAAAIVPHVTVKTLGDALVAAALIAVLRVRGVTGLRETRTSVQETIQMLRGTTDKRPEIAGSDQRPEIAGPAPR